MLIYLKYISVVSFLSYPNYPFLYQMECIYFRYVFVHTALTHVQSLVAVQSPIRVIFLTVKWRYFEMIINCHYTHVHAVFSQVLHFVHKYHIKSNYLKFTVDCLGHMIAFYWSVFSNNGVYLY